MEFVYDLSLFAAQVFVLGLILLGTLMVVSSVSRRSRDIKEGYLEVKSINDRYDAYRNAVRGVVEGGHEAKIRAKITKAENKQKIKSEKRAAKDIKVESDSPLRLNGKPVVFVLSFDGDPQASQTDALREEITAILLEVGSDDEVLLKLESPGGTVHGYGLAASQLMRLKDAGVRLTISVDKVAASGGYMMACVGERILAAPFAIIGSIGVVAQVPNVHRLLKRNDIDVELFTAGEFKRTVTTLNENTDKDRKKFREELEEMHQLFKQFVHKQRSSVDIEAISTGEIWYGQSAITVGLIDEISTSDSYLQLRASEANLVEIRYRERKNLAERFGVAMEKSASKLIISIWNHLSRRF